MAMLFSTSGSLSNSCYIVYDSVAGSIRLFTDNAQGSGSKLVGSTTVLQNSQCAVGTVSISSSSLSQIVNISVTFKAAFGGLQNIYMFASNGVLNTGWVQRGAYFVAAGGIPMATSVIPSAGSGPAQRFSFHRIRPGRFRIHSGCRDAVRSNLGHHQCVQPSVRSHAQYDFVIVRQSRQWLGAADPGIIRGGLEPAMHPARRQHDRRGREPRRW